MIPVNFEAIDNKSAILTLETEWIESLTFPNDDYWEAQLDDCQYWKVLLEEELIGYACVTKRNTLYQFYITPKHLMYGTEFLGEFIKQRKINKAVIGTNNPTCYSLLMHFQKTMEIDGYMFKDMVEVASEEKEGEFREGKPAELERLVNFQMLAMNAAEESRDWFRNYIGSWMQRGDFFVFEKDKEIVGTLEVRTCDVQTKRACLGMIVGEKFRRKGYGTFLLIKGKEISRARNIKPICSCAQDNVASLKAIERSGFRKLYLMQLINLQDL